MKFSAFDEGTMVFYTQEMSGAGQVKTMANVTLKDGITMTSSVVGVIETSDIQFFVTDDTDTPVKRVLPDGTERDLAGLMGENNELTWSYDPASYTVTIDGPVSGDRPLLAAGYDGDGKMLSVTRLTAPGQAVLTDRPETVKLFWTDKDGKPLCACGEL